ncbi:MAG TPA: recombination protein O N-terminal domain-containing protein [Candidatus Paceibacterota bacterium]
MYQKYQTEALVMGNWESGEADRVMHLFSRDFGLVAARAGALRREKSKMRYALTNYSRVEVSLIRGKNNWRLAGTRALHIPSGSDPRGITAFARIAELVTRLVTGEETNPYLFAALSEAHNAFMQKDCGAAGTIELVCVARVLYSLGYISAEALKTALFTHTAYADVHLAEAETLRDKLLSSINRAIAETQL